MSDVERYGVRDLTYSAWHREASIGRFLPTDKAHELGMIDLDALEYCRRCSEPLALVETAQDVGQTFKATTVMKRLAVRASMPALLVFWTPSSGDISGFRMRVIHPYYGPELALTPPEYAAFLWNFRLSHPCYSEAVA